MIARFNLAFSATVFLAGLLSLLFSFTVWYRYHVQIPIDDTLHLLPVVRSAVEASWASVSLEEWLAPHAGAHRVFVTRFLMVFDYAYMGGKNTSIYLSVWLSIVVLVLVYIRAACTSLSGLKEAHLFLAGLALIFICSPTQYWNLVNPINASWYVAFAASAASVWILISCGKKLSAGMALLACCLSAIAALSSFSGLIGCLMLPVIVLYHRSRNSAWVVLFSVIFVALYMQGIESGSAKLAKSEAFMEVVRLAIEADPELANTWFQRLSGVAVNAGLHLGAPLSAKYASLASGAVLISVVFLVCSWIRLGLDWYKKNDLVPKAIEFYLVMATICLGVSAAIWLGRAVFINPVADRYQTITMLYWLSISCLFLCHFYQALNRKISSIVMISVAVIPLVLLLGAKTSSFNRIAVISDSASRTQILGSMGLARLKGDNAVLAMDRKDYLAQNFEFLSAYSFTPIEEIVPILEQGMSSDNLCSKLEVDTKSTQWPGVQRVSLSFDSNIATFLRRLDLIGANGERGRLYSVASKQHQWQSIALGSRKWDGFYRGDMETSMPVELVFNPVFGRGYHCRLSVDSFQG